jgi:hypothetical protein
LPTQDKERYQEEMAAYRHAAGLPDKPAKRRRSSGASAVHAHLRSIDDLVQDEVEDPDSDAVLGKRRFSATDVSQSSCA